MEYNQNQTNLIISGLASTGTTITSLILATILKKRYLYAGGTFKFIAKELGYKPSEDMISYEQAHGEGWDNIWEPYVIWKLKNDKNILTDAKIAGFFVDAPHLFKTYLIAAPETRITRAGGDGRTEDVVARDRELSTRWKALYGFDILNEQDIRNHYDLYLETDNLEIEEVVLQIQKNAKRVFNTSEIFTKADIAKHVSVYEEKGKGFYYKLLGDNNLIIPFGEIFHDWLTHLPEYLEKAKPEWREVVEKYAKS